MRTTSLLLIGALMLAGCKDPAKESSKASTGEAVAVSSPVKGAVDYTFDGNDSKITWKASKVSLTHDGGFGTFNGVVHLVDATPEKSSVTVDIDAASIRSDSDRLTGHLKSADFFDVTKFAKAKFESTEVKKGGEKGASHTITGNLTMHGVTKSITFPAKVAVNGDTVSVDADFVINRKDWGLTYPGKADDLISDDVFLKLAVHAKRRPA